MNKFLVFSIFSLIVIAAAEWEMHKQVLPFVRELDQLWVEFNIGNSGNKVSQPAVTMVRITEKFQPVLFSEEGAAQEDVETSKLSRLDYATFLYSLGKFKTRSVAFYPTPTFSNNSSLNNASIFPLKNAALRLPRMVVATVVSSDGAPQNAKQDAQYKSVTAVGDFSSLAEITRTVIPGDPELLVNGDSAFSRFENDTLASSRFRLIARQGDNVVIGFILAAVAREANIPFSEIKVDLESDHPVIEVGDRYRIPIAKDGSMALPSQAGLSDSMYTVSTADNGREIRDYRFASLEADQLAMAVERANLIAQTVYNQLEPQFDSLSQNLVIIGVDRLADRTIEAGVGKSLSPMVATAMAIATIQSQRHTVIWPVWFRAACYISIFLIAAILFRFGRVSALLTPLVLLFFLAILVLIFKQTLAWMPLAAVLGLFVLLFLFALTLKTKRKKADEELEPQSIVA